MRPSFFNHLHPPTIPAEQARWRYTLGAGGAGVFLLLVVAATGILEMFYYVPTPDQAAVSVQTISYLVPFGGFVRNLHFWSAQLLVIVSAIHLGRVVFTGSYAPPRAFNYLLGHPDIAVVHRHLVFHGAGDHAGAAIDAARGVEKISVLLDGCHIAKPSVP